MQQQKRFLALDVFRGMTICFMIIVNTSPDGDHTFAPLLHAKWHGFTPTDLVFPSFLFAVGNAMSFVMPKWEAASTSFVLTKIFKRTLLIFLLGYLMYWFPFVRLDEKTGEYFWLPFDKTRVFGVLQRIALAYCFASLMLYFLKFRTTVIITAAILILYYPVMYFFGDAPDPLSLQGNAVVKLDLLLVGPDHLYHGNGGVPFDPEGFLSTFPAIGNVVAGFWVGRYLKEKGGTYESLTKLMLAGFTLLVLAHFWNYSFPINKKLWTSSFVLHTVGLDCLILAAIVYIADIQQKTSWTPFFQVFGKNPLFIYMLSELLVFVWNTFRLPSGKTVFHWLYENIFIHATPYVGSLLQAIAYMLLCWVIGWWMDKKKIYVKV